MSRDEHALAHPDDWDHHWDAYGSAAKDNPANAYRRELIVKALGDPPAGSHLLDIGCGQGELTLDLARAFPALHVTGLEYSQEGIRRARAAAAARRLDVAFGQADLLRGPLSSGPQPQAEYAVCSEVLEHLTDPVLALSNARGLLAPGCRLVITVPGGPRSAFDRHIGHLRHFTPQSLRRTVSEAGYETLAVWRAGVPFFNVYKLAVVARGDRLIDDVTSNTTSESSSAVRARAFELFRTAFKYNLRDAPFGWQLVLIARVPEGSR